MIYADLEFDEDCLNELRDAITTRIEVLGWRYEQAAQLPGRYSSYWGRAEDIRKKIDVMRNILAQLDWKEHVPQ